MTNPFGTVEPMKRLPMTLIFAFFGMVLELVAFFINLAFTEYGDMGSHWMLKAIVLFCVWPNALIFSVVRDRGSPSPWDYVGVIAPIIGWALFGGLVVARWFPEPGDPRFEKQATRPSDRPDDRESGPLCPP
ncbi:MAG TPA: hypothetical protein VGG60_12600 [Candidatus Binataceae bacterium]